MSPDAPPRLTPYAEVAPTLAAMAYSPLPIAPGTKFPGSLDLNGEPRAMRQWDRFCSKPVPPNIIAGWSKFPDAGVGVALGRGLIAVDVDRDNMVDAILDALPTSPVMKRGRVGVTAFFREGATPVPAKNYNGFLDLLSTGKQTVLPPTRHATTGLPYVYTTERTLLDTPLSDLPEFPADGVAIIESVLARFGWNPKPARPERAPDAVGRALPPASGGAFAGDLDELNTAALGLLSSWVPFLNLPKLAPHGQGYRGVASFRPSGSGKADSARNPNLSFHPTGIVDQGEARGYRPVQVVGAALGLDWRDAARWLADRIGFRLPEPGAEPINTLVAGASAPSRRGEVAPPEQPERRPLVDVKAALAAELNHFARRVVPEQRHARAAYESAVTAYNEAIAANVRGFEDGRMSFTPLPPKPVAPRGWGRVVGSETGSGKTTALEHAIAPASRSGFPIYPALPRHAVAEQVVEHLRSQHGVSAEVLRGRYADDPDMPGRLLCHAPEDAKAAQDAHLSVDTAVCGSLDGPHCPFRGKCGYMRQPEARPDIWAVQHAHLPYPRPEFVPAPAGLAVDETFNAVQGADETQRLGVDALAHMGTDVEGDPAASATLAAMRPRLVAALRNVAEGYVTRDALLAAGITVEGASVARKAEWGGLRPFGMVPGMDPAARAMAAQSAAEGNGPVAAAVALWGEVTTFLREGHAISGRMKIVLDRKSKAATVEWRSLKRIHESWLTGPVLFLDATPPGQAYVEAAYGAHVEVTPMLAVERNPHGREIQVVGAPTSGRALGLNAGTLPAEGKLNRARVLRYVRRVAAEHFPQTVVVIGSLKVETWLGMETLPTNVDPGHFYGVSGMDHWRKAAALIQVGRNGVPSLALEADAGVLTGTPAQGLPPDARGVNWYQRVPGAILKADGSTHVVAAEFHPDPVVEALRWRSNEGESLQTLGRLRQVHRDSIEPWEIHILNDQPLPLAVDEVRRWADVSPEPFWDLAGDGVLFADFSDIMRAWPVLSKKEAREREASNLCPFPCESPLQGKGHKFWRATFRRKGKREVVAYLLPHGPRSAAAFKAWLIVHGFEGVADVVIETRPADRLALAAVVRSMNKIEGSPSDVWDRIVTRFREATGREPNTTERAAIKAAAKKDDGDAWDDGTYRLPDDRFIDRACDFDPPGGEAAPDTPDAMVLDDCGNVITPEAWRGRGV